MRASPRIPLQREGRTDTVSRSDCRFIPGQIRARQKRRMQRQKRRMQRKKRRVQRKKRPGQAGNSTIAVARLCGRNFPYRRGKWKVPCRISARAALTWSSTMYLMQKSDTVFTIIPQEYALQIAASAIPGTMMHGKTGNLSRPWTSRIANGRCCAPRSRVLQPDPWSGWVTPAGGLPFTALLTIYLSTLVGRAGEDKAPCDHAHNATCRGQRGAVTARLMNALMQKKKSRGWNETLEQRVAIVLPKQNGM